jgi:hypothetical protein
LNRRHTHDWVRQGLMNPSADIPVIHALAVPIGRLRTRRRDGRDVEVDAAWWHLESRGRALRKQLLRVMQICALGKRLL